jgi:DNA-directed RNA polymerase specialized sigma24 family protein
MRVFGGLSIEETAVALGVSPATVKRNWSMAKAWLMHEFSAQFSRPESATCRQ